MNNKIVALKVTRDGNTQKDVFTEITKSCPKPIREAARELDRRTSDVNIDLDEGRKIFERGASDITKTAGAIKGIDIIYHHLPHSSV